MRSSGRWGSAHAPDALRSLLRGLIDDASLYPPAALPMQQALAEHGRHRDSPYASLQGRFVVAASRLDELFKARDAALALRLSVILDVAGAHDAAFAAIARVADLQTLAGQPAITVDSFEIRLGPAMRDVERTQDIIEALATLGRSDLSVWFELPYDAGWAIPPSQTLPVIAALATRSPHVRVGAKMRTGGLTPNVVPSCTEIAAFIVAAQHARVPWKATAGLHHPVRHNDVSSGSMMHGFLNVFIAAAALHAGIIDDRRVVEIVTEEDARAFVVDGPDLTWRDCRLDATAVAAARAHATSFGSCSFAEPIGDLIRLGLLA